MPGVSPITSSAAAPSASATLVSRDMYSRRPRCCPEARGETKNRHKQLGHIRRRQAAGNQEQPLHRLKRRCGQPFVFQQVDIFHNALMQQCLADISGKARNACDRCRAHEKTPLSHGLFRPQPRRSLRFSEWVLT